MKTREKKMPVTFYLPKERFEKLFSVVRDTEKLGKSAQVELALESFFSNRSYLHYARNK